MADVYLTIRPCTFELSHTWKTSTQLGQTGNERRTMLFTWPRLGLTVKYILSVNKNINWFKRQLIKNSDSVWAVPIWADETELTGSAASGQKTLAVADTGDRHFYDGRECIIINPNDFLSYEVGTIESFTATGITLVDNLASTWPAGSLVSPLYDFRIEKPEQEINSKFIGYQTICLELVESFDELRTFAYTIPTSSADTYLTHDLFLYPATNPITYKYRRPFVTYSFLGLGYHRSLLDTGKNYLQMKQTLMRSSRADIWKVINFFDSKRGRFAHFWVPTRSKDIVATASILAGSSVINIEDISYTTFYLPNEIIGRYVYIQFPDKTYACRKITAASSTTITLDSAIGTTVAASDLSRLLISFLLFGRFEIDTIELDYIMKDTASIDLVFAGLLDDTDV